MGNSESATNTPATAAEDNEDKYPAVFTPHLLKTKFNGSKADDGTEQPIYIAVNNIVLDVQNDRALYGPGGEKHDMTGKNNEVAEEVLVGLKAKYPEVGILVTPHQFTKEELAEYDGTKNPYVFLCAKGEVFDVTPGRSFYGPGGGYHLFAGHDASRALALMSLNKDDVENTNISDLDQDKLKVLDDWVNKYHQKYTTIGWMGESIPESVKPML